MARYVESLFVHKLRFLALFVVAVMAASGVGYQFLSFRASAVLEIQDPSSFGANFVPVGWSQSSTPAENLSDTIAGVLNTSGFAEALTNRLERAGDIAPPDQVTGIVSSVVANLKVTVSGAHLLTLSYSCHSRDLCVRVLGEAVAVLQSQLVSAEEARGGSISSFWSVQLKDAQARFAAAQSAVTKWQAAHPGATVAANSSDSDAVQLYTDLELWRGKVAEAQAGLTQADYLGLTSARLMQLGLSVAEPAHLASSRYIGDGMSLIPAAAVLAAAALIALVVLAAAVRSDRTVRDPRAIEKLLGVPVVATIPKLVG
jgi:hypothetical protein